MHTTDSTPKQSAEEDPTSLPHDRSFPAALTEVTVELLPALIPLIQP